MLGRGNDLGPLSSRLARGLSEFCDFLCVNEIILEKTCLGIGIMLRISKTLNMIEKLD